MRSSDRGGANPGNCLAVTYEAVDTDGVQHVEHTLVDENALYVAHSEASGVQVFHRTADGVFDGPGCPFDLRLIIGWDGDVLTWAWHWAPAGEDHLQEQSRATARPADA